MNMRGVLKSKGRDVITIAAGATVSEAVALLVENNIGSLPVVDDAGRLVGIFTERDVMRGLHAHREAFCKSPMADVMTRDPLAARLDDSIHDAMGQMSARSIGQLPVLDGETVVGLVSIGDLVRLLHQAAEDENRHLLNYVYGAV